MDLKVKILDIFIFCSVPPYESVYTVDRDTTTDTDNTNNNFFAYSAIAKFKYCIIYLCTQISPKIYNNRMSCSSLKILSKEHVLVLRAAHFYCYCYYYYYYYSHTYMHVCYGSM